MTVLAFAVLTVMTALFTVVGLRGRRRLLAQQNAPKFSIAFDSAGFVVTDLRPGSASSIHILWPEIHRMVAYKRDLFAYDCICLFVARADDTGIELDEQMVGWAAFCEALPRLLPGCTPHEVWFRQVAFPAFATNLTELYARAAIHGT